MKKKCIQLDETLDRALAAVVDSALKFSGIQIVASFQNLTQDLQGKEIHELRVIDFDEAKERSFIALCDAAFRFAGWQVKQAVDLLQVSIKEVDET